MCVNNWGYSAENMHALLKQVNAVTRRKCMRDGLTHERNKRCLIPKISLAYWRSSCEKERYSVDARKFPIVNGGNAGRCIGIDDHNVSSNIEWGVIQRRNEGAQEPCHAIMVYFVVVAKPCIVDGLQSSVRISQPIINNTCESHGLSLYACI